MQIQLSHGGGGGATADLIQRIFAAHLGNPILNRMEDAAVLNCEGSRLAMTTDSFVITPVEFPGGDIGRLAVAGTVNDLLMMGAVPRYLTAGFILEAGLETELLERLVVSMADTARETGVQLVAADTKVVEGHGPAAGLFINTSGIGWIEPHLHIGADQALPGDVILILGNLGDHQAAVLSKRLGIRNTIVSDVASLHEPILALLQAGVAVHVLRDITRGGLATVLNEIMSASGCQAELQETAIPVAAETRALCEVLGMDPLSMANEGKFVAIVSQPDAERALAIIRSCPCGRHAVAAGQVTDGHGVVLNTRVGGRRRLTIPWYEGLPRIC